MARGKTKISGRVKDAVDAMYGNIKEPKYTPLNNTNAELGIALNFYAKHMRQEDSKTFALNWVKENKPELLPTLQKAHPNKFKNRGFILRIYELGFGHTEEELQTIVDFLSKIEADKEQPKKKEVVRKPKPKFNVALEQFDAIIDKAMMGEIVHTISLNPDKAELLEVIVSADLIEMDIDENPDGYDPKRARVLKRTLAAVRTFVSSVLGRLDEAKRKEPVKKIKPMKISKRVQNLDIQTENSELGLKGIHPTKVFGCDTIIMFDTKYKNIHVIVGKGMEIRGKTIQNFDPEKSKFKLIKDPKSFFRTFMGMLPAQMIDTYEAIDREAKPANGRLSDRMIILKAF